MLIGLSLHTYAQPITHIYFGGGILKSEYEMDPINYQGNFFDATESVTTTPDETEDTGWILTYGYQFHKYFAFEASYQSLGEFTQEGRHSVEGLLLSDGTNETSISYTGTAAVNIEPKGLSVAGVALWPVTKRFSVRAKAEARYFTYESKLTFVDPIPGFSLGDTVVEPFESVSPINENMNDFGYGVGLELNYRITWDWSTSLVWHRYLDVDGGLLLDEFDADSLGLQIQYHY
ncbi:hypothetical protein GCM10007877_06740 [Marinibactrum halimedae]|uniref:Outer membrane protein OmpA-like transmembrane domain-containing protein n=2 Tax=Marinibactrum halimedae TaxID=1444977 RepID=A0AA37T0Y3_9GAMM|nr:hypothetical protein GCM10007877_06740 [Marinibactrum halimedae]